MKDFLKNIAVKILVFAIIAIIVIVLNYIFNLVDINIIKMLLLIFFIYWIYNKFKIEEFYLIMFGLIVGLVIASL